MNVRTRFLRIAFILVALVLVVAPFAAPTPVSEADEPNLVANPGCEGDILGWTSFQGSLSLTVDSAHSGAAASRIDYADGLPFSLDDLPATVQFPVKGARYTATAWVRSDNASGASVRMILRQIGGSADNAYAESDPVVLSWWWQPVSVSTTIDREDRHTLDLYVTTRDGWPGSAFDVDDISLVQLDQGSVPSVGELNKRTYSGALFSDASPWNQEATGPVDPNSDLMLHNLQQSLWDAPFYINSESYGVPIFYADASTPWYQVEGASSWFHGMDAPIPDEALPDASGDHHLVVWDLSTQQVYEFWRAVRRGDGWADGNGIVFDARGLGFQRDPGHTSARAYGGSLAAGAIRYQELRDGRITHALAMAYPTTRGDAYALGVGDGGVLSIASNNDRDFSGHRSQPANIPLGARLRMNIAVNLDERCGGNAACHVIGQALKTYGAYVVDSSGRSVFFAENLRGKDVSWSGLLDRNDAGSFQASDFEVLSLPPLTPAPS